MNRVKQLIAELELEKHPEGGYFRRIYESKLVSAYWLDEQQRAIQTAIIYLLDGNRISAFHRIRSDELWFLGEANTDIRIIELQLLESNSAKVVETILSRAQPVHCVTANTWFAAELVNKSDDSYALSYCTVAPGFDFKDFELASRFDLMEKFPEYHSLINRLCKS